MSDTYNAIYEVFRNENVGHYFQMAAHSIQQEMTRPSAIYRPLLSQDGNEFCALLGEDLQVGIAGFGDTPDAAMRAFDTAWYKPAVRGADHDQ